MKQILFIIAACISIICSKSLTTDSKLIELLRREISHVASSTPANYYYYIINIGSSADFTTDKFELKHLESVLRQKHHMPEPVISKFRGIAFSKSVALQSFCFSMYPSHGYLREFIVVARNNNGLIEFAFLAASAFGKTVQKYNKVKIKRCKKVVIFFKKCHWETRHIARGNTVREINIISQTLRAIAYLKLNKKVNESAKLAIK